MSGCLAGGNNSLARRSAYLRHSGAMRSIEPGIHNPCANDSGMQLLHSDTRIQGVWIPGSRQGARPGMTRLRLATKTKGRSMAGLRSNPPCISSDMRPHAQPSHALVAVGIEEGVVVAERDAAVGVAVRAQHIGVRKQA